MDIEGKVAVVTGAASGIGSETARMLAAKGAKGIALVDLNPAVEEVAAQINHPRSDSVAVPMIGNTTDAVFRAKVYDEIAAKHGVANICVPAAGITRDSLCIKYDKETRKASIYSQETFELVTQVNLIAPIYWALEMVARNAEDRARRGLRRWNPEEGAQGAIIFIGSVSSRGIKGQIAYSVAKAGLEGAAATLSREAIFHGVRCGVIHPGFTDTPMVRALGTDYIAQHVLPYTQLRRLIRPEEIADAICFMISNSAVSGELWADAGWHPSY
jgi:NAD(P)-dependent dehydrogenase (short-subunit alcohol dehydrogenase family)